jgi:hypothetical protein
VFKCSRFGEARGALFATGTALAAALVALVALSGCGVLASTGSDGVLGPGVSSTAPRTYTVTSAVTTVVVNGGAGTITVTGSDRATVQVTEQVYYSHSDQPPVTSHAVAGGTLTLSYSCPAQLACGVAYDVAVPRGMTVRASDHEGAIMLTSLSGPVTAQTTVGSIDATSLTSPRASLTSRVGPITVAFTAAPASVSASTNAGPITLRLPSSATYQVSAHTLVGPSIVKVPQNASSPHVISASSDLGPITILSS